MDRSPTHKNISMAGFVCKGIEFENWCRCINISKISKLGVLFYTNLGFQGEEGAFNWYSVRILARCGNVPMPSVRKHFGGDHILLLPRRGI